MMTRHNFTKATLVERFQQCGGRCEGILPSGKRCNIVLVPKRWHGDHDKADGLGGEPTLENCRCLCLACHAVKTPNDQTYIAEAKRREAKNIGIPWPKPIIRSRGFPKAEKPKREQLPLPERKVNVYGGRS